MYCKVLPSIFVGSVVDGSSMDQTCSKGFLLYPMVPQLWCPWSHPRVVLPAKWRPSSECIYTAVSLSFVVKVIYNFILAIRSDQGFFNQFTVYTPNIVQRATLAHFSVIFFTRGAISASSVLEMWPGLVEDAFLALRFRAECRDEGREERKWWEYWPSREQEWAWLCRWSEEEWCLSVMGHDWVWWCFWWQWWGGREGW